MRTSVRWAKRSLARVEGALPLFYMTISTGIGGGLVLADGHVYRGANSWASEIGHMTIRPEGPDCLCGSHGCLERLCCGLWLERDNGRPAAELFEDSTFVRRYVTDLALGLKAAIMILNPAAIVLGGGVTRSGDRLFVPLREELKRWMPPWSGAIVDVRPAGLGGDHVLWGAYALTGRASRATRTYSVLRNRLSNAARASLALLGSVTCGSNGSRRLRRSHAIASNGHTSLEELARVGAILRRNTHRHGLQTLEARRGLKVRALLAAMQSRVALRTLPAKSVPAGSVAEQL